MNCQTRGVSTINMKCLAKVRCFLRRATEAGNATKLAADVRDCSRGRDLSETLRRMLMDRAGIIDMLVKGRGSG